MQLLETNSILDVELGTYIRGKRAEEIVITLDELLNYVQLHGEGKMREYMYQQINPVCRHGAKVVLR